MTLAPSPVVTDAIIALVLVNAADNSDVLTLKNGDVVIDPTTIDISTSSNVRADVGADVQRVIFALEESGIIIVEATENVAPYALFGDTSGDYIAGSFQYDISYILTATPYSSVEEGSSALVAGSPYTVSFVLHSA